MSYVDFEKTNTVYGWMKDENDNWSFESMYLNNMIAGDTDSVVGDTIINIDGNDIKIEDYFNKCQKTKKVIKNDIINDDYVYEGCGKSLCMDADGVKRKPVKYVMKHKVKKRMFKITVGGKSVTVTEDHSVIVKRNGELISVKPQDITEYDLLITLED